MKMKMFKLLNKDLNIKHKMTYAGLYEIGDY